MKTIKIVLSFVIVCISFLSCSKEEKKSDEWQFTKMVNANLDNEGGLQTIDIYQQKGDEWRVLQFEPDDFTIFNLKNEIPITPNDLELPVANKDAFMTSNGLLFSPKDSKIYDKGDLKWTKGSPVQFNHFEIFKTVFPDIPTGFDAINKFTAATFSYEKAYDNNSKVNTFLFYDFPNEKYLYYGIKTGTDLLLQYGLDVLCENCDEINWKNMDAVICTGDSDTDNYYFFDFEAKKMYILFRENKNTNNPSFTFDTGLVMDFDNSFRNKFGSINEDEGFDFSK